jgi:hypothetical protein
MDINAIVLLLMVSMVGLYTWRAFLHMDDPPPSQLPWVPLDVNKPRSFVNKTNDAGMFIERVRRTAIIGNPSGSVGFKGSTNGSLEWNFLTSVCVCPPRKEVCPPAPNVVWSDGDADDEICDNVDAGGAFGMYDVVDFGGAGGNDCDV